MPIVFNGYAFMQALLLALIGGFIYVLKWMFGFSLDWFETNAGGVCLTLLVAWFTAFTEVKGLRGRLFFLPTWIFLLLAGWVLLERQHEPDLKLILVLYAGAGLIIWYYITRLTRALRKGWAERNEALSALEQLAQNGSLTVQQFWVAASHLYFRPTFLFLHVHWLWRYLFSAAINADDFVEYYRRFYRLIPVGSIPTKRMQDWILDMRAALNNASSFRDFQSEPFGFTRLASVIDESNRHLKS